MKVYTGVCFISVAGLKAGFHADRSNETAQAGRFESHGWNESALRHGLTGATSHTAHPLSAVATATWTSCTSRAGSHT